MCVLLVAITALVVAIDQLSKYVAFKQETPLLIFNGLIELVHARNDGFAFGLGGGLRHGAIILSILSILTIIFLLLFFFRYTQRRLADTMSISLIIGGAIGNLIDRLINHGKVLDFIQLRFINWPAFNIADTSIVAGVILMVFTIAFEHAEHSTKGPAGNQKEKPAA